MKNKNTQPPTRLLAIFNASFWSIIRQGIIGVGLAIMSMTSFAGATSQDRFPYSDWAVEWWTWALETPVVLPDSHPGLDDGIVDCSIGQQGSVWYLAGKIFFGGKVRRNCSVPEKTTLFFPLYNSVYINFATDPTLTPNFCKGFTHDSLKALGEIKIKAWVDGRKVEDSDAHFEDSSIFSAQMIKPSLTESNLMAYLFGSTETEFPNWLASANCDFGWYKVVAPLSRGKHTIAWLVKSSTQGVLQNVEYQITVVAH